MEKDEFYFVTKEKLIEYMQNKWDGVSKLEISPDHWREGIYIFSVKRTKGQ